MNRKTITLFPILLAALAAAHAEGPILDGEVSISTRSRAEVIAELDAARRDGSLQAFGGEDSGASWLSAQLRTPSLLTRAQVRAEVLAARQRGELDATSGEDSGSFHFARHQPAAAEAVRVAVTPR